MSMSDILISARRETKLTIACSRPIAIGTRDSTAPLTQHSAASEFLNAMGGRLCAASPETSFLWHFHVNPAFQCNFNRWNIFLSGRITRLWATFDFGF